MILERVIMVEPVSKLRARTVRKGKQVITYTPSKTVHAENLIRDRLMEEEMFFPKELPLHLDITFFRVRPKHAKKAVRLPTTKPDLDNYLKLVKDAIRKFVYEDDSQITTVVARKRFCLPEDHPRIEIKLTVDQS